MSAVLIEPLVDHSISQLISLRSALKLSGSDIEILEFCQTMSSECWTGYVDGKLICCWGLIPPSMLSQQAYLWMHSTPAVCDHAFLLVRHSQKVLETMLSRYPRIIGHCHIGAIDSIRWLRWLGASFGEDENGLVSFVIKAKSNGGT